MGPKVVLCLHHVWVQARWVMHSLFSDSQLIPKLIRLVSVYHYAVTNTDISNLSFCLGFGIESTAIELETEPAFTPESFTERAQVLRFRQLDTVLHVT